MHDLPFSENRDVTLTENLYVEQWIIPSGTVVKVIETSNFGVLLLPENCKDVRGYSIPNRIFKY